MSTSPPGNLLGWLERRPTLARLYSGLRRWLSFLMFVTGFIWDSLTLNRIDHLFDNLVLLGYLVVLAAMIFLILRNQAGRLPPRVARFARHYRWITQFFLGGLLAKYVVFYFKSASWTRTSVFLALLVVLLVGNEFLEHRLENAKLLGVLFFFCLFSFLAFFLPVVLVRVSTQLFLIAGVISLGLSLTLVAVSFSGRGAEWLARTAPVAAFIAGTYVLLHVFYFANLIPPVPIALRSAGIYHSIARTPEGYRIEYLPPPWYRFWSRWEDPFLMAPGETVYCYSAVFAPPGIRLPVYHRWSRYERARGWVETDRIQFPISGGREGGFRGFTHKRTFTPGRWRVELETGHGRILGKIDFTVILGEHGPLKVRTIP